MAQQLRARLREKRLLLAPGVYDALTALLAEQAGFEALYLSGASIAYTRLGRPDIGLVTASEVADTLSNIRERVALPIIVDADTGFGNALNVIRTVKMLERAGASAIQLEDQLAPKRCGHLDGKALIGATEMAGKIRAALDTREHALIVAQAVTSEATDNTSLQPMAEAARDALGTAALQVVADAGYSNGAQAEALEAQGIVTHVPANRAVNNQGEGAFFDRTAFSYDEANDTLRCPAGKTLRRKQLQRGRHRVTYAAQAGDCAACPLKARCTQQSRRMVSRHLHEAALQRMHERATPEAMRLRRCIVEHPFASLKYRIFEKPRFLLRGRWGAGTEMAFATLAWNLKRAMKVLGNTILAERLAFA